jgi:hypothetical protein
MSNRIKIKRNSTADFDSATLPSSLHYGELAFQNYTKKLFIGRCTADGQADSGATTIHLPLLSDLTAGVGLDATIASGDTNNSVTLDLNVDGLTAGSALHQSQDHFIYSDNGTEKKITFSDLEDAIFGNVSGDATVAAGGALTIAANAVEGSMLNTNVISGQTAMTGDLADADELMVSDAGTIKRADFSVVRDAIFNDISGDAAVAAGGALTIAADSVEGTMLNTNAADTSTIELSSDTLSVLKVPNALTAGTGITAGGTFDGAAARTISITPAQTAITSILNTSLKMGRESDSEYIDFSTDGETRLAAGGVVMVKAIDATQDIVEIGPGSTDVDFKVYDSSGSSAFSVQASDGAVDVAGAFTAGSMSIGTLTTSTSLRTPLIEFTDGDDAISIVDGGAMTFAKGFTVTAGATAFNANVAIKASGGTILQLNTSTTDVDISGILGRINFSAPDESAGTDAVALAASIVAQAAADFTSSVNKTDLIFYTGNSGTATEAMKIGWDNKVTITGDLQVNGTTTTINSTTTTLDDPIITLGGDSAPGSDDDKDRGVEFRYHTGSAAKIGFFGFDDTDSKFKFIPDASNSSEVFSGSLGNVEFADVEASTITSATIDCGTY